MVAITLAIQLLLMNLIGIFIRKKGIVNKAGTTQITNLVMQICIPCLIFYSISNATEFSTDALANCAIVVVLGAVGIALGLIVGQLFFLLNHKDGRGRIQRYGLIFTHFSFMGIPVIAALFGDTGTFYYSFFLIPVRIAYYALSEQLMTPSELQGEKKSFGKILKATFLTPQMIAVVLGLIFWVGGWQLPTAINYCVKSLNSICSPLALLLCGMVIGEYDFKKLLQLEYLILPLVRTIVMPALLFGISRLLLFAGVDELLCNMLVVYGALPTSSLLPVYAMKYDPDPENHLRAAGVSMISVFVSAITIPIWYIIL